MYTKAEFIHQYQKVTGAHYKAAEMLWTREVLSGDYSFIFDVLRDAERRKAGMKVKVVA